MKAWCVHDGWPEEGSLLVFAETRNKARYRGAEGHPLMDMDYRDMCAIRAPKFDDLFDRPCVISDNSELPEGTPELFWSDEDDA